MTFIYIIGSGHSGSTLLDIMLARHSSIAGTGELSSLPYYWAEERRCSCGQNIRQCLLWRQVMAQLGPNVIALPSRDNKQPSILDNTALHDALVEATGAPFLVDSSKGRHRLSRLLAEGIDVRVIHLVRDGRAVACSHMRKGRPYFRYLGMWVAKQRKTRDFVAGLDPAIDRILVRYTDLVTDPAAEMARILGWLGLAGEHADWGEFERPVIHNLDGNDMRRAEEVSVRFDDRFLHDLPGWRWALATIVTMGTLRTYGYPWSRQRYLEKVMRSRERLARPGVERA